MLVHEEELREAGVGALHQHEPRRGEREIDGEAGQRVQAPPWARVARQHRVQHERRAGDRKRDESLRQRRACGRRVRDQHPVALRGPRRLRALREQERAQRERQPERQDRVEGQQVREPRVPDAAREHERREDAGVAPRQPRGGEAHRDDRQEPRERRRQPRRPLVHAERVEGRGAQPVLERRLFEVLEVVQARRHPVAADRHLARDLGVPAFVRVLQPAHVERPEPYDRHDQREQPPGPAGKRCGRRDGRGQGGARTRAMRAAHSTVRRGGASALRARGTARSPCANRGFAHTIDRMRTRTDTPRARCCPRPSRRRRMRART